HSLWQAYTMEMSMDEVGQQGFVSRIVSGCPERPKKKIDLGTSVIGYERFGVFYAPTFNRLPNGEYYAQYNRPNGIWYWLNHTEFAPVEQIFVLLDPDMYFMRKLGTYNVVKGKPAAQLYRYMADFKWWEFNKTLCPLCDSLSGQDPAQFYAGPPWI